MRYTLCVLVFLLITGGALSGQAQEKFKPFTYLNLFGGLVLPVDDFGDRVDRAGFGFGGYFATQLVRAKPVFAGFDLSYHLLDSKALDLQDNLLLRTRSNMLMGHLLVRYQPAVKFPVWPYVDLLLGTKRLYTRTKLVEDLGDGEKEILEADTDLVDWALSYGGALGLQVSVHPQQAVLIDFRCGYLVGGNAEYYARIPDPSSLTIEDSLDYFEKRSSNTPLVFWQLGVTLELFSFPEEE